MQSKYQHLKQREGLGIHKTAFLEGELDAPSMRPLSFCRYDRCGFVALECNSL